MTRNIKYIYIFFKKDHCNNNNKITTISSNNDLIDDFFRPRRGRITTLLIHMLRFGLFASSTCILPDKHELIMMIMQLAAVDTSREIIAISGRIGSRVGRERVIYSNRVRITASTVATKPDFRRCMIDTDNDLMLNIEGAIESVRGSEMSRGAVRRGNSS